MKKEMQKTLLYTLVGGAIAVTSAITSVGCVTDGYYRRAYYNRAHGPFYRLCPIYHYPSTKIRYQKNINRPRQQRPIRTRPFLSPKPSPRISRPARPRTRQRPIRIAPRLSRSRPSRPRKK